MSASSVYPSKEPGVSRARSRAARTRPWPVAAEIGLEAVEDRALGRGQSRALRLDLRARSSPPPATAPPASARTPP